MNLDVPYGITRRLPGVTLDDARARVAEALKSEGFGVLTEIDLQATLRAKLGVESPPYRILGACNPVLAHRAVSADPGVGLLLPCNVVIASDGGDSLVSAISPKAMFSIQRGSSELMAIADEAEARIRRAVEKA